MNPERFRAVGRGAAQPRWYWRAVGLSCALLIGCAAHPPVTAPGRAAPEVPAVGEVPAGEPWTSEADLIVIDSPPTPVDTLESDPLYRLLVAEFAGQRGELTLAVDNYLALARASRDPALAERATKVAVFARNNAAALDAALLWAERAPDNLEARQIAAAMYIRQGNADAALEQIERVLAAAPSKDGTKLRMIANLLGREEAKLTALAVMEKLLAKRADDPDALVAYALLAMRAEQLDKARSAMERLVTRADISPNMAMAYMAVLQKQGLLPEAVGFLEQALARTPGEFGLRLLFARLLAEAERFEEARVQFQRLNKQAPDNTDVIYALGLLNLQTNRAAEAERDFRSLAKVEERADDANFYLGQIEEARKNVDAAIARYAAVEAGPNHFQSQLRRALLHAQRDEVQQARTIIAGIEPESDEEREQIVMVEAEMLASQNQLAAAMAVYDRALANKFDATMMYNRAMLADRMGRLDLLEADLREILKRDPKNVQAMNALGYTLADRTERYDEAHRLIEGALALSPNDFYILDSMGWVLYRMGRLPEAVSYLEKARALRNDPEVAAHLGEVLWVMGRQQDAREVWNSALELHPQDEKILDAIKRLTP